MNTIKFLALTSLIVFSVSCGNNNTDQVHTHEADDTLTHEADATHTHEADATHTHEADATHTHEADATHTHEADATHTHETDATHTHEADATHTHEADATHTHESDATQTHEADATHAHEEDAATELTAIATATVDHKTLTLSKQNFYFVKKTSGQIMVDKKDEVIITAKSPGIVRFNDHFLYPGLKIAENLSLFTVSGEELTENNAELNFARVKADYNEARSNYDRAKNLIDDKIITEEHFLQLKNEFEKAEAEYNIFKTTSTNNASLIRAPEDCYLKEIFVKEGEMVNAGDKLVSILIEHNMVLRADVPPTDFEIIDQVESAKFATGYAMNVYNTNDMNGYKISYGRSSGENSFYIPLYFRINFDSKLIPGTFADVWLIGKEKKNVIVIPNNAILEEFGKFYVYIDHGDHFDKRFITPGESDGENTLIISGLSESESIVTDGVYQVKMSMMTSIPNTHDHSH